MTSFRYWVASVLLAGLAFLPANADQPASQPSGVPRFASLETSEINKLSFDLIARYQDLAGDLIAQLRDESLSLEGKVYIAYVLGELRASCAVPELLDLIDLNASSIMKYRAIEWHGTYPAQVALAKIGMPAVEEIIKLLPSENRVKRKKLMCQVIEHVLGPETGYRVLEKRLAARASTTVSRRRDLLDYYRTVASFEVEAERPSN